MHRPAVNITRPERIARVVFGIAGTIAGVLVLASTSGVTSTVLVILLVLAGLDLVVTGALGHCPLYKRLGHVPPSLRKVS